MRTDEFEVKIESERFTLVRSRSRQNLNLVISRCCFAEYGKENACCTKMRDARAARFFLRPVTNDIRDLKICDGDVDENVTSKYHFALS